MAADRQSPSAIRQWLVRLGQLRFDDFLLVSAGTLDFGHWTPDLSCDWAVALNNAPDILAHFRSSANLQSAICNLQSPPPSANLQSALCTSQSDGAHPCLSTSSIASAQSRLVTAFAFELLREKAPPLYDALPWQDWDFSTVTKRFKLWQTRLLLAGEGTTVAACRCRKSAGVYVLESCETIAGYIEQKCTKEKVRRLQVLRSSLTPSLPLPSGSVDLAILGSYPDLETGNWKPVTDELLRVAANVLLIENSPLAPPLDETPLIDAGFLPDSVAVSGLGPRRCWWKRA